MDDATGKVHSKTGRARKSSRILTLIALAGCGVALAWVYRSVAESRRPATRWARELRSGDSEERQVAARQLGDSGLEALDVALPALLAAMSDADEQVRAEVARNLGVLGSAAMQVEEKRAEAREAARALTGSLLDEGPDVRMSAALAFGQFAGLTKKGEFPADPAAVAAALVGLLADPSVMVRGPAESTLIRVAQLSPIEPPPALLEGLNAWPLKESRTSAAVALGSFKAGQGPAVPALVRALLDKEPEVRGAAATALGFLAPASATALPALAEILKDPFVPPPPPKFEVRFQSVGPGGGPGPGGMGGSEPTDPATQAARAIGRIARAGKGQEVAVPEGVVDAVAQASKAERPALREAAGEALRRLGK